MWRAASVENRVAPPRLDPEAISWRVSLPSASHSSSSAVGGPKVALSLGVQSSGGASNVGIELDKAGVDTFLEGLTKIKEQLSKV